MAERSCNHIQSYVTAQNVICPHTKQSVAISTKRPASFLFRIYLLGEVQKATSSTTKRVALSCHVHLYRNPKTKKSSSRAVVDVPL